MKAAQQVPAPSNNGGNGGGPGPGHMLGGPGGANTPSLVNSPPPSGGLLGGECHRDFFFYFVMLHVMRTGSQTETL